MPVSMCNRVSPRSNRSLCLLPRRCSLVCLVCLLNCTPCSLSPSPMVLVFLESVTSWTLLTWRRAEGVVECAHEHFWEHRYGCACVQATSPLIYACTTRTHLHCTEDGAGQPRHLRRDADRQRAPCLRYTVGRPRYFRCACVRAHAAGEEGSEDEPSVSSAGTCSPGFVRASPASAQ